MVHGPWTEKSLGPGRVPTNSLSVSLKSHFFLQINKYSTDKSVIEGIFSLESKYVLPTRSNQMQE